MVLIDNMKMPNSCKECRFCIYEPIDSECILAGFTYRCAATRSEINEHVQAKTKAPDCPLKEVWKRTKRR